jgi:3-hydroxyisobutyrate dehydrogenase-like beta-hydroxyacid dehydrogenase
MQRKVCAFVGLGTMGLPMATNILRAGFSLQLYDTNATVAEQLAAKHAEGKVSLGMEAVADCDVVILCLPDGEVVERVVASLGRPGQLVVDCSTTSPETSKAAAEILSARDAAFIDAPVTGEQARAESGELTIMVGGTEGQFDTALPLLQAMASEVIHVGEVGHGQITKAMNNCLYNVSCAAMAEILPLAAKNGMNLDAVRRVISAGSGQSFGFDKFAGLVLDRKFDAPTYGYPMESAFKDMQTVRDLAEQHGTEFGVIAATEATYSEALAKGLGRNHKGGMIKVWEDKLDVECRRPSQE